MVREIYGAVKHSIAGTQLPFSLHLVQSRPQLLL
jgi:hypothetical protein